MTYVKAATRFTARLGNLSDHNLPSGNSNDACADPNLA